MEARASTTPSYGLFNGAADLDLGSFGGDNAPQPDWITEYPQDHRSRSQLIWQWTPFMMLILLAGLQSRDPGRHGGGHASTAPRRGRSSAHDAAAHAPVPGAGRPARPIYVVQTFDAVFTITSGGLGTANLPYTIYQTFFSAHDYGLASAQGVVVVVGTIIIATFALRTVSSLLREERA